MKSLLLLPLLGLCLSPLQAADPSDAHPPSISLKDVLPRTYFKDPSKTPPPAEVKAAIETFFTGLENGETQKSYDALLVGSRIAQRHDQVTDMVGATDQAIGLYGKMLSYELYDNYSIGSSLMVLTYMTNLQTQPLRWRFVYYKADKTWQIMNLRYDDVIDVLLD